MSFAEPNITPNDKVGALAARLPAATRVFERYRIDYCCAGARTLAEAASAKGVDVHRVVDDLVRESSANEAIDQWNSRPLDQLIAHIVENYHRTLEEELPRLLRMANRVLEVHGDRDRARLQALRDIVEEFATEMFAHMQKEERVLFPMILAGEARRALMPIQVMQAEHEQAGRQLEAIRALTDDFVPPPGACATWRGLWLGLADLEKNMHEHVHLENNILFPRALAQ